MIFVLAYWSDDSSADGDNRAPSFSLIDQTGQTVTNADYLGSYVLLFFGYTYCPDICPTDLAKMADAVDGLGDDAGRVQPLFITIDPSRDTVEVLRDYVRHFHPRLVGLTGEPADISAFAARYGVRSKPYRDQDQDADDDSYYLDHTGAMYLLGPDGSGRSYFQHEVAAADITAVIRQFMARDEATEP
jgi:protein SCO1/2